MYKMKNVLMDNEPGSGGGAGGDLATKLTEMEAQLASQNSELDRLRTHSSKLLDEKKKLQNDFKAYESLGDLETLGNLLKQFEGNEDAKLFAEGKGNEVLKKHTERLSLDFQAKIDELTTNNSTLQEERNKYANLFHESIAGQAVSSAAIKAGIRDTAIDDALMRSKGIFTVAEDGKTLEARDSEGNLIVTNGKALTPDIFVEKLREDYPHYWPESKSSGARGGASGDNTPNPFIKGDNYNLTAQARLRKANPELADRMAAEAKAGG